MKRVLVNVMLVLAAISFAVYGADGKRANSNSNGKVEEELMDLTRQMVHASLGQRDLPVFERIFADDLIMISSVGSTLTKAQVLDIARNSNFAHNSSEIEDLKVRVFGNLAVLLDRTSVKGRRGDKDFDEKFQGTRVFVKRNGIWQIVASQVTKIN